MSERSYHDLPPMTPEVRRLRRLLCIATADQPYMDDGEAQDRGIDFMRDSVEEIEAKLRERNIYKLKRMEWLFPKVQESKDG